MRTIPKGREPASLTTHRKTPHSDYDNYPDKAALRRVLVSEQRGICCYCMGPIRDDPTKMKIEHWRCRSRYPAEELSYRNLLAACPGGDGQPPRLQHCDTQKGDDVLRWNPAEPQHRIEKQIFYEADGGIRSHDREFDRQIADVLNLNLALLRNHRKGVLDAILRWWHLEKARVRGPVPRGRLEQERNRHADRPGTLAPYCQVAVWWLDQRLARLTA